MKEIKEKNNYLTEMTNQIRKRMNIPTTTGISPIRYCGCFLMSNITMIYFLFYAFTAVMSVIHKEFDVELGKREQPIVPKPILDSQIITLITSLILLFYSIIRIDKQHIRLSYSHLSILINYYIYFSMCYLIVKYIDFKLKDVTCQSFHNSYKSISSFSFTSTFFFLVSCRLISSTDNTIITSKQINVVTATPQYPPAPLAFINQSIGPFSCRYSRCCEKFLFGFHCHYHFIAYHLLVLFAISSIFTSNDMLENGNHSQKQIILGVLFAYVFVFIEDFIEFYCRPYYNAYLTISVIYFIVHYFLAGNVLAIQHFVSVFNVLFSLYIHYKSSHEFL